MAQNNIQNMLDTKFMDYSLKCKLKIIFDGVPNNDKTTNSVEELLEIIQEQERKIDELTEENDRLSADVDRYKERD